MTGPTSRSLLHLALLMLILVAAGPAPAVSAAPTAAAPAGVTLYVKQSSSSNSCADWEHACFLQTALNKAQPGDQIWVAKGTYTPSVRSDPAVPRSETFLLKNYVTLYGGFDPEGGDDTFWERSPRYNPTILSGDLSPDGNMSDNAYHVVTGWGLNSYAVLDGFTIEYGRANGAAPYDAGGGMYNNAANPTLINVIFRYNEASLSGGGMFNYLSSPKLTNVLFTHNTSHNHGGGLYNWTSSPVITNVTVTCNTASVAGGGVYNNDSSAPVVTNSIVWGNYSPTNDFVNHASSPIVSYSDIHGWGSMEGATIHVDPLFFDSQCYGMLSSASPAVDAGNNAAVPAGTAKDLWSQPRWMDVPSRPDSGMGAAPVVDMGAYEVFPQVRYVDAGAAAAPHDGSSWEHAYTSLQTALTGAPFNSEFWVAEGTYKPAAPGGGRNATFVLGGGYVVYGGFPSGGGDWAQRDPAAHPTILSGDINNDGDPAGNAYHVVANNTYLNVLDGLTITGGNANGTEADPCGPQNGGGICSPSGRLLLRRVSLVNNIAALAGGGIYNRPGIQLTLSDCTLAGNGAQNGGGIFNAGNLTVNNRVITDNTAQGGGGIWNEGELTVSGSVFESNHASGPGGGLVNHTNGIASLTTSALRENTAQSEGGGIRNAGEMYLTQSLVAGNSTSAVDGNGGGIYNSSYVYITSSTLSGNFSRSNGGGIYHSGSGLRLDHNTLTENQADYDRNGSGMGAGIYIAPAAQPAYAVNSIIAGNYYGDCAGATAAIISLGYNLAGDGSCHLTAAGDQPQANPWLAPLSGNGGFTWTHALLPNSPALDAGGPPDTCFYYPEQRGFARVVDGNRDGVAACDIGAYELQLNVYLPLALLP